MAQQAVTHNGNTLYLPSWDSQVKGSTKDGDDHMHEVKELFLKTLVLNKKRVTSI